MSEEIKDCLECANYESWAKDILPCCDCEGNELWEPKGKTLNDIRKASGLPLVIKSLTNYKIYEKAIAHYGVRNQMDMAIEEMAELIKELNKYKREMGGFEHIQEEIADVLIMMEQMRLLFDLGGAVDGFIEAKTQRLKNRIEGKQ